MEWLQRIRLLQSRQDPDPKSRWAQEQEPEVKLRNRYMNVQAWANNRIHLRVPEPHCDYINASPIALPKLRSQKAKTYIASQVRSARLWHNREMEGAGARIIGALEDEKLTSKNFFPCRDRRKTSCTISGA